MDVDWVSAECLDTSSFCGGQRGRGCMCFGKGSKGWRRAGESVYFFLMAVQSMVLTFHSFLNPIVGHLKCCQFFIIITLRPHTYFITFFISLWITCCFLGVYCVKRDSLERHYEPFYRAY